MVEIMTYTVTLTWNQAQRIRAAAYTEWPGDEYRQLEAELRAQGFPHEAREKHTCTDESDEDCPCVSAHIESGGCAEVVADNPPERD